MFLWLISFLLIPSLAFAQPVSPPLGIQDEGGTISRPVFVIDCVGSGVSCSQSGITGTITASGGGGSVTSVTASTPLSSTGGTTPNIAIQNYTGTNNVVLNNSPTMTSPTVLTSISLPSSAVDAIGEIATALKSGVDGTLITGTEGTSGNCAEWNADGDLVEAASGAPCGSGGGDSIQVNSSAATDANFVDGGIGWTLNTAPAVDQISASLRTITSSALLAAVTDETGTGQNVFNNTPTMTSPTVQSTFTFEQTGGTDIMTGATGGIKVTGNAQITYLASCNTIDTDSNGIMSCGNDEGAPTNVDYLVGTANGSLSAEIIVGTTPGGQLGGTWASPTIDASHSGSTHHYLIGADDGATRTDTFWIEPYGRGGTTETNQDKYISPETCTASNMYAEVQTAPGAGNSWTVCVNVNGTVLSEPCCTISGTEVNCNETVNTGTVTGGQTLNWEFLESGTATGTATASIVMICTP